MKSTHKDFKKLTYTPDMDSSAISKADKKKAGKFKNDHEKKLHRIYIPEQRLWILADKPKVFERMQRDLREPILIHSKVY